MLEKIANMFINKRVGFVLALIIAFGTCYGAFPEKGESYLTFVLMVIGSIILLSAYGTHLYKVIRFPHAKKGEMGVLFVINALNEKMYDDVVFNFTHSIQEASGDLEYAVKPIFVNASRIENYNVANKKVIMTLLRKTSCVFCINVVYKVDDAQNAYNYEMTIQTKFVNDAFSDSVQEVLKAECDRVSKDFENVKFTKDEKLDKLKVTAQSIEVVSEYVIALMLLFTGEYLLSLPIFKELYERVDDERPVKEHVRKGYYHALNNICAKLLQNNRYLKDKDVLDSVEGHLETMNSLYPDTFNYHLTMANIVFLKYRNVEQSLYHTECCKAINTIDGWKYSKAFLTAYTSNDARTVLNAYRMATQSTYNVQSIIEYIEFILSAEPDKVMLHFALGLLYNFTRDSKLTLEHLRIFNDNYHFNEQERAIKQRIRKILKSNPCELCDRDECAISCFPIVLL